MRGWEGAAKYEDNFLECAGGRLRRDRSNARRLDMQTYLRESSIEELLVPSCPKRIASLLHQDSTLVADRLGSKEACRADGRLRVGDCDVRWGRLALPILDPKASRRTEARW